MIKIQMQRKSGDFGFEARDENGHLLQTDSSLENGGSDFGFRPMQLLLAALGSCSAIDIVSILKKQRQTINSFEMVIEGEREQGTIPSLWKEVKMLFVVSGDIDAEKAQKACALSIEKYCSVAETLRRGGATIRWELKVKNGQVIGADINKVR
jgi:putative redox protein